MIRHLRFPAVLALAVLASACASPRLPEAPARPTPLLLVSVDGLRPQDITPEQMPRLAALADAGVRAEGLRPSYPSLTFPNHYTLVTGLRPDRHGIVHNSMHDRDLGDFRLSRREAVEDARWWGGTPVWVSVERAGLHAATMYWPGSEAAITGVRPRQWQKFDAATPAQWRADTVAGWLLAPAKDRPDFATLYFDKVDHASHQHGPASSEARAERADTDAAIGRLLDRLQAAGMLGKINLVVVSDHGFAEVPPGQRIAVEDMVGVEQARAHSVGQVVTFTPNPGHERAAEATLLGRHAHYQCWKRDTLPAGWHYGDHGRVPPIVCQMDEGWDALPREVIARGTPSTLRGSHGYDPALASMRASFIAHGPAFRPGSRLPLLDNVDVYPLLMRLLGLPPEANDGQPHAFDAVLQPTR